MRVGCIGDHLLNKSNSLYNTDSIGCYSSFVSWVVKPHYFTNSS